MTKKIIKKAILFFIAVSAMLIEGCSADAPVFNEDVSKLIVIDAGHGLPDAGALGIGGTAEEGINLLIAKKLEVILKDRGYSVKMTRTDENALGESKNEDMRKRRQLIETADICVSIHQNSFPKDPNVYGAQVFYAEGSVEGEKLAASIQKCLNGELEPNVPRQEHVGDYYIVKSGKAPSVIVECGFISNEAEEQELNKSQYQVRIAHAIAKGIDQYLEGNI